MYFGSRVFVISSTSINCFIGLPIWLPDFQAGKNTSPKNYFLHLDRFAPQQDRDELATRVQGVSIFEAAKNVFVVWKANFAYQKGSTFISATLRGASILLRLDEKWDWFVILNDLLHILLYMPKNLNFVNHTSYIKWKESKRMKPIIVDQGCICKRRLRCFMLNRNGIRHMSFGCLQGILKIRGCSRRHRWVGKCWFDYVVGYPEDGLLELLDGCLLLDQQVVLHDDWNTLHW